ncbi:MAG: biotin/lipoyl-containing protein, partial [Pseudomonadota bacterium]
GWRANAPARLQGQIRIAGAEKSVALGMDRNTGTPVSASVAGAVIALSVTSSGDALQVTVAGHRRRCRFLMSGCIGTVTLEQYRFDFEHVAIDTGAANQAADGDIMAPMTGRIVDVMASNGTTVKQNDVVVIMEAMKMEHTLRAPFDGDIQHCTIQAGDLVDGGSRLLSITPLIDSGSNDA